MNQRTFHIQYKKGVGISIDTDVSKFDTLETLILAIYRHYRDKRPDELDQLMKLLNASYKNVKAFEEFNIKKRHKSV
jgi:hypothetical protein